jgi:iron complex outermembrane receptor protein
MNLSHTSIFRAFLIAGFLFLLAPHTIAQTKVSGSVVSGQHESLKQVNIRFKNGNDVLNTSSDSSGRFQLVLPKPGNYMMTVSAIGYLPYHKEYLNVGTAELVLNEIILTNSNEELQTVEIVGTTAKKYFSDYSFSATKTATLNKDIPQSISTIAKELIADRQAATLADAVKSISEQFLQSVCHSWN